MASEKNQTADTSQSGDSGKRKSKNFVATEATAELLEKVKAGSLFTIEGFVNRCIEDYGPELIQMLEKDEDTGDISLEKRLSYLEETVVSLAYNSLVSRLREEGSVEQYQKALKASPKSTWSSIKKNIRNWCKKHKVTYLERTEWQTLLRKRDDFMELDPDEE